jgi:ABC-2 type transport system ATP-binding protein
VLGLDVTRHAQAVRERIGLAGQYAAVDENLTGSENMRMVGRLSHLSKPVVADRAVELLERFALSDAADRPVRTYSGGMRRRLDLAAALLHRPPVLFLDEPTTGLDPSGRQDLWGVIEGLVREGTTLLLTTQYLEEADRLADNIVVIDHGRVIAEGTSSELKATMGATIVEVGFADPATAKRAQTELARHGLCDVGSGSTTVELKVDDGARVVLDVVRSLDHAQLEPTTLTVREPTLDDVFLSLTGHKAEEDQPEDEQADAGHRRTRGAA